MTHKFDVKCPIIFYTNMKKLKGLLTILFLLFCSVGYAQNILSLPANLIQPGDSITKERVKYVYAGDAGKDVIWDFSNLEKEDTYYIKYDTINQSQWEGYDTQKTYYYRIANDGMQMTGYESPLLNMDYKLSLLILPFPLQFNQTYSADFLGEGRYCGTHYERTLGAVRITADAQGTLILSESDTLYNTLRVYTVNTMSIRLSNDSCYNDADNMKQVITEHYQWYARGYRYPVFETITSSTYDNMNHVATQQLSYRCPPEIQMVLNDSINERIRLEQQQLSDNNKNEYDNGSLHPHGGDVSFTYGVNVNGNHVIISYNLDQTATIHAMMVDVLGNIYHDMQQTNSAGSNYLMSIDTTGLRRGQYIIYINVNGKIYNTKISVK